MSPLRHTGTIDAALEQLYYRRSGQAICDVCQVQDKLVVHHDHFYDFCSNLLYKHVHEAWKFIEGPRTDSPWTTFADEDICAECNAICPEVKRRFRFLPRFVSFSPAEMTEFRNNTIIPARDLKIDRDVIERMWRAKKDLYRPRLQRLVELGVPKEAITAAWTDRSYKRSPAEENRQIMLRRLATSSDTIKRLTETPGNDEELALQIRWDGRWTSNECNSFIYWYHKKHGDPNCRNNDRGVGPVSYASWFVDQCQKPFSADQR